MSLLFVLKILDWFPFILADNLEVFDKQSNVSPRPRINNPKVRSSSWSLSDDTVISPESLKNKPVTATGSLIRSVSSNSIDAVQSSQDDTTVLKTIPDTNSPSTFPISKQAWTEEDKNTKSVHFPVITEAVSPSPHDETKSVQKLTNTDTAQPFQTEFIKNMIDDSIEEMR